MSSPSGAGSTSFELEVMRRHVAGGGAPLDTVIVHTCAVTGEAVGRRARRSGGAARAARRAHRCHRLRGADRAPGLCGDARGRPGDRQWGEAQAETWAARCARGKASRSTTSCRCARRLPHLVDGFDGQTRAFRSSAARLRPSLHVLHHPLWARNRLLPAGEDRRPGARAGRHGYSRGRPHRRRHHDICAEPRPAGQAGACGTCRT